MSKHAKCPQCGGMADKMWQGSESDMFACPHCDNSFSKKRANKSVQPTIATAALEDSPFETGIRRNAVVLSNRNSG